VATVATMGGGGWSPRAGRNPMNHAIRMTAGHTVIDRSLGIFGGRAFIA
jgi:hypothetical protein